MFLKNVGNRKIIFFSAISARVQKNFERKKLRVYQGLGLLLQAIIDLVCAQNFPKTNISYLLMRTCACMYQGVRNVSSSKNFESALNEWYPNSRFTKHMELLVWEFLFFWFLPWNVFIVLKHKRCYYSIISNINLMIRLVSENPLEELGFSLEVVKV